jgi:hypothetical protein
VRGVLSVLADHPEGLAATDVLKAVEQRVPPTPHEQADYPNHPGIRRFEIEDDDDRFLVDRERFVTHYEIAGP